MISHIGCVISNIAERDLIRMPSNFNKRGQYLMNQLNTHQNHSDRIIRETECRHMTGLCRTTRYLMEKKGDFPARRQLGGRSVGWLLSEITTWQLSQPKVETGKAA